MPHVDGIDQHFLQKFDDRCVINLIGLSICRCRSSG
jgi:hypothetical protein